jgi:tetratricopeptide (TPR) repeat protein
MLNDMSNSLEEMEGPSFKVVPVEGATQLAVIFSSVNMKPGQFTFYRTMEELDIKVHKLYVHDPSNGWYQSGIPGLGSTIDETVESILKWKKRLNAEEIVTIGSSMGAYACILYGAKLNARVLAFGARVLLGMPGSASFNYVQNGGPVYYKDLLPLVEDSKAQLVLYQGEADANDIFSAKHFYGLPNVDCVTIRGVAHKTPLFLSKKYGIKEVFKRFILNDPILNLDERGNLCESGNAVDLLLEAYDKLAQKLWNEAEPLLKEVINICPKSDVAHHKLGIALYQLGKIEESVKHQAAATEISPHFGNAFHQLGIGLRKLGRVQESYSAHKRAYELTPDSATAFHHAGISLEMLENFHEAEEHFRKAVTLDKKNTNYIKKLAVFLRENATRKLEESEELLLSLIN